MLRTHKLLERHANGAGQRRWATISLISLRRASVALSSTTPFRATLQTPRNTPLTTGVAQNASGDTKPDATQLSPPTRQKEWDADEHRLSGFSRIKKRELSAKQTEMANASRPSASIRQLRENPRPIRRPSPTPPRRTVAPRPLPASTPTKNLKFSCNYP